MSSFPVLWIVTNNAANLAVAPEAVTLGIAAPRDVLALAACEWAGWGNVHVLVTTRDPGALWGEFDTYWGTVSRREVETIERALSELVS